eukprot:TRINITY_DN198_c0_g1_i2.p1 TRINITY_DN198_c0_g1~~TRINITY_DN198_c0_g1_i2.p1  ORF type:complete len:205 (-),score=53.52 TRINITY_DN198_c0_g1_i2:58-672(-)
MERSNYKVQPNSHKSQKTTQKQNKKMSLEFFKKKWATSLNYYDFNGDGNLSKDDANSFVDQFNKQFKGTEELKKEFNDTFHKLYDSLLALDTNGDGKVDAEEVFRWVEDNMIKQNKTEEIVIAYAHIILKIMDLNGDGKVSKEEYLAYAGLNPRKPVKNPEGCFSKLDINGDGFLTIDELYILFREYYTSPDPNARGNFLYGEF